MTIQEQCMFVAVRTMRLVHARNVLTLYGGRLTGWQVQI